MATTSGAVLWNAVRVIGQSGLGLIVSIVLARLLSPDEFGLLALVLVFIAFTDLVASAGLSSAVVQQKALTKRYINVAQTLALLLATVFSISIVYAADFLSQLFDNDRLGELVPSMAMAIWLSIVSSISRGILMREMNFKRLMVIDFIAHLLGYAVISVVLAFMGYGAWSLILGMLASSVISALWLVYEAKFSFRPSFSLQELRQISVFGGGVSLNNIIGFISLKASEIVVGKHLGFFSLGLYSRAVNTAALPFLKIALTISSVMFSAYSSIQNDKVALNEQYLKAVRLVSASAVPILVGLWVCAEYVVLGLFGNQWRDAVVLFEIACIGGIFNNVLHLAGAVVQATNNVYKEVWRQFFSLCLVIVGLVWVVQAEQGLEAVVWVTVASAALLYILMAALVIDILDGSWGAYFLAQLPGVVLSIPVVIVDAVAIHFMGLYSNVSPEIGLLLLSLLSATVYGLSILILPDRWIGGLRSWVYLRIAHKLPSQMKRFIRL